MKLDFRGDVRDFLQINPWFAGLPDAVQAALVEAGRRTTLAKGQWLYAEGDASSGLSAVLTGSLRIAVSVGPERDVLFDIAGPGAILGHPVGLAGRPRLSTARAGGRSQVFAVPMLRSKLSARPIRRCCGRSTTSTTTRSATSCWSPPARSALGRAAGSPGGYC